VSFVRAKRLRQAIHEVVKSVNHEAGVEKETMIYQKLALLKRTSLRFKPVAPEIRYLGFDIFRHYVGLSDDDRERVRESIDDACSKKLLSMSGVLAEEAMNSSDVDWIAASIGMHAIENFRYDYRENYRHLVLAYFASSVMETDLADVVREIESIFSPGGAKCMLDFCGRDDAINRLWSFGIEVKMVDGRRTFAPIDGAYGR